VTQFAAFDARFDVVGAQPVPAAASTHAPSRSTTASDNCRRVDVV
jgi:hypothetical protein